MHRRCYGLLAALSFAACLASGILIFLGYIEPGTYRNMLAAASLAWFVFAAARSGKPTRPLEKNRERNSSVE